MQLYGSKPLYSAKDLLNFLGCTHATALDLGVLNATIESASNPKDEYLDLLKEKGNEHERRYLEQLTAEGRHVVEIKKSSVIEESAEDTLKAMKNGADVVYQGTLTAPGWHGYSDFLLKVNSPSNFGAWSYEVADTKLARSAKPKHVVQLCIYSEMIAREQEVRPDKAYVVLGDGSQVQLRLHDYQYYCNRARERFETFVNNGTVTTEAERCPHCSLCHWTTRCDAEWNAAGNLRLVAGLSSTQAKKLRAAGITTIDALGSLDSSRIISRIQDSTLARLRDQARLQVIKRTTDQNVCEVLPLADHVGFARMPKPSNGDLFFDMEGDPAYSPQGSLEYLFGFHYVDNKTDQYKAFWARDKSSEKKAFEDTLDFITARLERYPNAFTYHYASYEQTALKRLAREYGSISRHENALKRLAQSYGTRENEVDDLLRNQKLVDLYAVVREAVRTSEPAYSLKNLEKFFAAERTQDIKSGGDSVVAFERWLKTGDDKILQQLEEYNSFDCHSTRLCRDWLISLRPEEAGWLDPEAARKAEDLAKEEEQRQADAEILEMRAKLVENVDEEDFAWRELLGLLLEYHRREARSEWWRFFERCRAGYDAVADVECIGSATVDSNHPPRPDKRSSIWRLQFPEQDFKLETGDSVARADLQAGAGTIFDLNEAEGWLELRTTKSPPTDCAIALIPAGPLKDTVKRAAIKRYATAVLDGRSDECQAITSILRKDRPRLVDGVILRGKHDMLTETIDAVARMERSHLVIQGPPGSGKTYTSAHAIVSLMDAGKRVGVMSLSHKAINNLLSKIEQVATSRSVRFQGIKIASDDEHCYRGPFIQSSNKNDEALDPAYSLVGGTAWLFSRDDLDKAFDYLFIDEAGQVSLADVVATGLCAKNIVLVGDQMQLPQPTKGQHPGGSGVSGLDYLMGDWAVVPSDRGIFLDRTWRMHPRLCRFISDAFYDSRLQPDECTTGQMLDVEPDLDGILARTGLRFVPVDHKDNAQKSIEEAMTLGRAYQRLLGKQWVNQRGETHTLTTDDILVVSPYNMQVNLLKQRLPAGARVGTVDKFQGQEAAVVLVSMASSNADEAPRGIDFLFSRNRLNVALSRARCLSVIFCSPALLDVVCADLEKMKLVNTVCWAKEYAAQSE
jgi:uncharacterized protein